MANASAKSLAPVCPEPLLDVLTAEIPGMWVTFVRQDGSPRGPGSPPRVLYVVGWGAGQDNIVTREAEPL